MQMFTPYFHFGGRGFEAMLVYEKAFNAEVVRKLQYKDMPPNPEYPIREDQMEWLLNGELDINGHSLLMSDTDNYVEGRNVGVNISEGPDELRRIWSVLIEGATDIYELGPTFFSPLHGSLKDRFGVTWMFTAPVDEDR